MYFFGLVIIPRCELAEVESKVDALLYRYCIDPGGAYRSQEPIYSMAYQYCPCRDGKSLNYARRVVREKIGSLAEIKEQVRGDRPGASMLEIMQDLRFIKWWKTFKEALQEYQERKIYEEDGCSQCNGEEYVYTLVDLRGSLEWYYIGHRWHGVLTGKNRFLEQYAAPLLLNVRRLPGAEPEVWLEKEGVAAEEAGNAAEQIAANIVDPGNLPDGLVPVVVVTPDGNWHMDSQYRTEEEWIKKIKDFQKEYGGGRGYWAVGCAMKD